MSSPIYNAEISAGSLMLPESRRVARFLLTQPDRATWFDTLRTENILQKKSPATARRQARLIRNRLETLDEQAWQMVAEGEQELARQILFAASVKHSRLLGDFMRDVVAGRIRRFEECLAPTDWEAFLADCIQRDPAVAVFASLQGVLNQEKLAQRIVSLHNPDELDMMIFTGVGAAYPLVRSHTLLNALHPLMKNTPLLMFFPGRYDGYSLRLFNKLTDKHYYRAFRLVP